jgi:hypothetical protein
MDLIKYVPYNTFGIPLALSIHLETDDFLLAWSYLIHQIKTMSKIRLMY